MKDNDFYQELYENDIYSDLTETRKQTEELGLAIAAFKAAALKRNAKQKQAIEEFQKNQGLV